MPYGDRWLEVEFDFIDHQLIARTSDGAVQSMRLAPQSVADFYRDYMALLRAAGAPVKIWPVPREMADTLRFTDDSEHHSYDRDAVHRCWTALAQASRVLQEFRGRFIGKCSPVHFFWGAFDLACTRFSGRTAPTHPGGVPNLPDWAVREAYSHECISAGWWPGGGALMEPAFYAYCYPEPAGFAEGRIQPDAAYYSPDLKEFVLPYDAVRTAGRPEELLLEFLQSTYEAGANLGGWDRSALERKLPVASPRSSGKSAE